MANFKVGDKVKVVNTENNIVDFKREMNGKIGIISQNEGGESWSLEGNTRWRFFESELELINSFPREIDFSQVKIGDTVSVSYEEGGIKTSWEITVDKIFKTDSRLRNANGYDVYARGGGRKITLIDRPQVGRVGTVYSYKSVVSNFVEYYIVTERGLVKAVNVGDPNAKIETIPVAKLTELPTEQ